MGKSLTVVLDADALVALANPNDPHYHKSMQLLDLFEKQSAKLLCPVTAAIEAVTHIQRALGSPEGAGLLISKLSQKQMEMVAVNKSIFEKAASFFDTKSSKKNTLFDCIIAALAKEVEADAIFSFDKFYKRQGFKLAEDLMKQE